MATRLMSTLSLFVALGLVGAVSTAMADTVTERSEKTTTYSGVVTDLNPTSQTIVVKSETAGNPTTYTFSKETVFLDADGNVVASETVKNSPVTVYYDRDGDRVVVTKVVTSRPGTVVHKETTTTTTETR